MKDISVIVIPGLGGPDALSRVRFAIRHWRDKHTKVHIFDSRWDSDEILAEKLDRVVDFFEMNKGESKVVVVGFSAGGALATNLLLACPEINKVILISAKIKGSNTIGPEFVKRAPQIIETVKASEKAREILQPNELHKCISYRPIFDGVVPLRDMFFEGMRKKRIPAFSHAIAIGFALIFQIKRQIKAN